jgi:murein hydrolase activator
MSSARTLHSYPGTVRRGWLSRALLFPAVLSAGLAAAAQSPASAQVAAPPVQTTATPATQAAAAPDAILQRAQELEAARLQQKNAAELQAKLKADIAAIGQDRSKLNQQLIDIAAQVRSVENNIGEAETRLRSLDSREQQIRMTLGSRRTEVVEVLAALQRAGRRTPPALLVTPEDALQSLRTAMMLGAVVPELRARADELTGNLNQLVTLRKTISGERDRLATNRDKLRDDQTRLAALIDERQRKQASMEKDIESESARAIALSKQVDNLQGLITKMEQDIRSAANAAATANAQGTPATTGGKPDLAALKNPNRRSPAIAFASAKGLLTFPVNGTKIRDFGGSDGSGGIEKGISLASRAGAQVTTPCDGWVVYAGPFRSYGQLLILNAGGGYHVLIAGMERISVNIGQFVQTGEPVATMGTTSQVASIFAANASQPVLYVEFRKDGTPIDPGPWWAANEGEKVRG